MARPKKQKESQSELPKEESESSSFGQKEEQIEEVITYELVDRDESEGISLREAKVILILNHKNPKEIIIEVNGNGERILFDPSIHSNLKENDTIFVP
jgi:hypothetical protein